MEINISQIANITMSSNRNWNVITQANKHRLSSICIPKNCHIINPRVILISNINRYANIVVFW